MSSLPPCHALLQSPEYGDYLEKQYTLEQDHAQLHFATRMLGQRPKWVADTAACQKCGIAFGALSTPTSPSSSGGGGSSFGSPGSRLLDLLGGGSGSRSVRRHHCRCCGMCCCGECAPATNMKPIVE